MAEANIAASGAADARASDGSVTGFSIEVVIDDPAAFTFQFNADPYMEVFLSPDAAGTVNANLDVTFSITGAGGAVFEWSPSGTLTALGGTVELSPFDLNDSIDVGTSGASAIFNPCDNGPPDGSTDRGCNTGGNLFRATTDILPAGTYTISLNMGEDVDMFTDVIEPPGPEDPPEPEEVPTLPGLWLWMTALVLGAAAGLRRRSGRASKLSHLS